VPLDLRRYALSTLVNNLLKPERTIPFEFLVQGKLLRTSIEEYLNENGISGETVLSVEYSRALIPPLHVSSLKHDDWISSVDVRADESNYILSGGYDGLIRVWDTSGGNVLSTSSLPGNEGRIASIKNVKFLTASKVVSTGFDMTVRIWDYIEDKSLLAPTLELLGHKEVVESLAVHESSNRILSASGDRTIGFWSAKSSENPELSASLLQSTGTRNKRIKTSTQSAKPIPKRGPLSLLRGHNQYVSDVIFAPHDPTVAHSTSHDHTLRTWDLTTNKAVDTRTTNQALLCLTAMDHLGLLATGTSARHITLIDPRASSATVTAMTLRGHTNAVVSLASNPHSDYGLVSGSHDGTCRIWDIRSIRTGSASELGAGQIVDSIYVISRESTKHEPKTAPGDEPSVFSVCWSRDIGIVSAGKDKQVQINRSPS
jgi:WD40 repeat protein